MTADVVVEQIRQPSWPLYSDEDTDDLEEQRLHIHTGNECGRTKARVCLTIPIHRRFSV